jgi:uncharacterized protein YjiS (DUF1127 family)
MFFSKRKRAQRIALRELSQLDARLLRDIGIEPVDVYDALTGRRRSIILNPIRRDGDGR